MIRPATKLALEVVAGAAAVTLLLAVAAAWRLSQGPLPVSFLTPLVEQTANDQLPDNQVEIEDMDGRWTGLRMGTQKRQIGLTATQPVVPEAME